MQDVLCKSLRKCKAKKKKSTIDTQKKKRKESEHIAMETHQFTKDGCKKVEKKNGTIKIARRQLIRCY